MRDTIQIEIKTVGQIDGNQRAELVTPLRQTGKCCLIGCDIMRLHNKLLAFHNRRCIGQWHFRTNPHRLCFRRTRSHHLSLTRISARRTISFPLSSGHRRPTDGLANWEAKHPESDSSSFSRPTSGTSSPVTASMPRITDLPLAPSRQLTTSTLKRRPSVDACGG